MKRQLAQELARSVPAGVGSRGRIQLEEDELDAMLEGLATGWLQQSGDDGAPHEP